MTAEIQPKISSSFTAIPNPPEIDGFFWLLDLFVPGTPVSGQPKTTVRTTTASGKTSSFTARSKPAVWWTSEICHAAAEAYTGPVIAARVPLWMSVEFIFPRPKSARKRDYWKPTKPDRDNLLKCVGDALQGIVFADDGQVVAGPVEKRLAVVGERPGVRIVIRMMAEEDAG